MFPSSKGSNLTWRCTRAGKEGRQEEDVRLFDYVPVSQLMMMMIISFICSCRNKKIEVERHIYLEEGTYHKRLFRGPNTNDMI